MRSFVRIPVEGAKSLNDIAAGNDQAIYISDLEKSSIYKREESGKIEVRISSDALQNPNGLLVIEDNVYVAAWGNNSSKGNLLRINLNSKIPEPVTNSGIGKLDGIQMNTSGTFYTSDWNTGKIYKIDKEGHT